MKVLQIIILIVSFSLVVCGQSKSKFCGTIRDETGAIIFDAKVEAKLNKSKIYITYSDKEGNFEIEIPDGVYEIKVTANTFKKVVLKNRLPLEPRKCMEIELKTTIKPHQIT